VPLAQWYETTVFDRERRLAARFVVVPRRSLREPEALDFPPNAQHPLLERLGPDVIDLGGPPAPSYLPAALMVTFEPAEGLSSASLDDRIGAYPTYYPEDRWELRRFAEEVVFSRVIPFEGSPLGADSLATILTEAPVGIGLGAYIGFVAAGERRVLLFFTVPAGIIIVGAAETMAPGVGELLLRVLQGLVE